MIRKWRFDTERNGFEEDFILDLRRDHMVIPRDFYCYLLRTKLFRKLKTWRAAKQAKFLPQSLRRDFREWLDSPELDEDWWLADEEPHNLRVRPCQLGRARNYQEQRRDQMCHLWPLPTDIWWLVWQYEGFSFLGIYELVFPDVSPSIRDLIQIAATDEHIYVLRDNLLFTGRFCRQSLTFPMERVDELTTWGTQLISSDVPHFLVHKKLQRIRGTQNEFETVYKLSPYEVYLSLCGISASWIVFSTNLRASSFFFAIRNMDSNTSKYWHLPYDDEWISTKAVQVRHERIYVKMFKGLYVSHLNDTQENWICLNSYRGATSSLAVGLEFLALFSHLQDRIFIHSLAGEHVSTIQNTSNAHSLIWQHNVLLAVSCREVAVFGLE